MTSQHSTTSGDVGVDGRAHSAHGREPRIGLALGGGGARGLAHILALEVFDELGLKPSVIAGTSIGAMFGAAYASGLSAADIRTHAFSVLAERRKVLMRLIRERGAPLQKMLKMFHLRSAVLKSDATLDLVMPKGVAQRFEDLSIPLHIVATNFHKQEEVVFARGALAPALAASIAVPAIFSPVVHGDVTLVDGGLVNPLPFDVISDHADIIVAIDVSGGGEPRDSAAGAPNALRTIIGSLQILQHAIVREKLKSQRPDILIGFDVGKFHALDVMKLEAILKAAEPAKEELRRKLVRVLSAQTLPAHDGTSPSSEIRSDAGGQGLRRESGGSRLADRILGKTH